jgi:hypothetical protein
VKAGGTIWFELILIVPDVAVHAPPVSGVWPVRLPLAPVKVSEMSIAWPVDILKLPVTLIVGLYVAAVTVNEFVPSPTVNVPVAVRVWEEAEPRVYVGEPEAGTNATLLYELLPDKAGIVVAEVPLKLTVEVLAVNVPDTTSGLVLPAGLNETISLIIRTFPLKSAVHVGLIAAAVV